MYPKATDIQPPADRLLRLSGISYGYRQGPRVLDDVSWSPGSSRAVLLGPNGAGKTTLLKIAGGSLRPSKGTVMFGGMSADGRTRRGFVSRVALMGQRVAPIAGLTCREQVAYVGWLRGMSQASAWRAASETLERVGLGDVVNRRSSEVSGGELRRVGLAQTIVSNPDLVLLDEPTAGLDPAQRVVFRELVANLPAHVTLVVSTHQVDDLSDLFTEVTVLAAGTIRWQDRVERFLALAPESDPRRAESAFLGLVR